MQPSTQPSVNNLNPVVAVTIAAKFLWIRLKIPPLSKSMLVIILCTGLLSSCVTISPATVELSSQVGERIVNMEQAHQLAVQRYFEVEEQKVHDFMTKEWEPLFLVNFLAESNVIESINAASGISQGTQQHIRDALEEYIIDTSEVHEATNGIVRGIDDNRSIEKNQIETILRKYVEDDRLNAAVIQVNSLLRTDEPARIIIEFAEAAHEIMQAQRESLINPIREARNEVTAELAAAYAELIRGQSIITGRLEAARKNSDLQTNLLKMTGANEIYMKFIERGKQLSEDSRARMEELKIIIGQGNFD